jgi:hypothetical protein
MAPDVLPRWYPESAGLASLLRLRPIASAKIPAAFARPALRGIVMAGFDSLTDSIRGWFERSPKAQRAVRRFAEDLDVVAGHVDKATSGLLEKVGPIIDPPATIAAPDVPAATAEARGTVPTAQAGGTASAAPPVIPEPEGNVPPGEKQHGQPVDPTA